TLGLLRLRRLACGGLLLLQHVMHGFRRRAQLRLVGFLAEVGQKRDRVSRRSAVLEAEDGEAAHSLIGIGIRERVQPSTVRIDQARMLTGEQLEGEERRAAAGRTLIVEPAPQELGLLVEAKLPDRAIGDSALAVIAAPRRAFEVVRNLAAEVGERPLVELC